MLLMSLKTAGEHSQLLVQAAEVEQGRGSSLQKFYVALWMSVSECPVLTFSCSKVSTVETNLSVSSSFLQGLNFQKISAL